MTMNHAQIIPTELPPAALAAILLSYPRDHLAAITEALIAVQDVQDGDPDIEAAGDEEDGSLAEDEVCARFGAITDGPGCMASDPDLAVDDGGCDDINDDREYEERLIPNYGIDQTKEPVNEVEAVRAYQLEQLRA
jgi:hypothetical protein